ncbi:MAG: hypothetical protein HYV75_09690 [Opitutae bacterium]|nr:hypothetical protein [Opitutae bacterium]
MNARLPASVLCFALLGVVCPAAEETSRTPTPEPPKAYTDQGSTTTEVYHDYGLHSFNYPDRGFHTPGFHSSTVTTYYRLLVAPPVPPALGEPIPARQTQAAMAKFSPPAMLTGFVYEPFFMPLSPLLFSEDLSRSRREKLSTYRATRAAALDALRAKLDSLRSATPEHRQGELAAFAREQTPGLAELERTAEEMRANYVDGGFLETGNDWNVARPAPVAAGTGDGIAGFTADARE